MRTIAVVFGDNDFGCTFRPLMETLLRVIEYRGAENITEDEVRAIVKNNLFGHYIAFQHHFDHDSRRNLERIEDSLDHTEKYLLSKTKVLFDEEAEKHIAYYDHDHGSFYLELQSGTIASY